MRRKYAEEGKGQVFMTDTVLTTIMCAPRSVYSWDVLIRKEGGRLFFDTRDGSQLGQPTVAETAPEGVAEDKDSINGVQQLRAEASAINRHFSQQVPRPPPTHAHTHLRCITTSQQCGAAHLNFSETFRATILLSGAD